MHINYRMNYHMGGRLTTLPSNLSNNSQISKAPHANSSIMTRYLYTPFVVIFRMNVLVFQNFPNERYMDTNHPSINTTQRYYVGLIFYVTFTYTHFHFLHVSSSFFDAYSREGKKDRESRSLIFASSSALEVDFSYHASLPNSRSYVKLVSLAPSLETCDIKLWWEHELGMEV